MQFKLLNFHKFVANFATSLVGTFIPLMIYKTTGNIRLAVLFLFGQSLFRMIGNHLFKKSYSKKPQLMLILRVIPLLIYNISLIFLEDFMVVGIIIISISYGISVSIKNNANGVLLNYSSQKKSQKNLTFTRVVDALSAIVAAIAGGIFIDWNQTVLIIFSISLYLISVAPLFIYYLSNRKKKGFNKDFTSNAAILYDKEPELKEKRKGIVRYYLLQYFIFYSVFCVIDNFTNMYTLHLFISVPTFAKAGYLTAMFQVANLLGVLSINTITKKFDLKTANTICGIICAIPLGIIPFIQNNTVVYILFFIFGFTYAICSFFMMNSLMTKCKIVGCTNRTLLTRQDGIVTGQLVIPIIVMIFGTITPVFFVMVGALIVYAIYTFVVEDKLRERLVDYLQNNEIETSGGSRRKRTSKPKTTPTTKVKVNVDTKVESKGTTEKGVETKSKEEKKETVEKSKTTDSKSDTITKTTATTKKAVADGEKETVKKATEKKVSDK